MLLPNAQRWLALQSKAEENFIKALADPKATQNAKLASYLKQNADTAFGRQHNFASLSGYKDFTSAVPVRSYPDFEPWIHRIAAGEQNVLTSDPVYALEETSGSGGAKKWIPFTSTLRSEFETSVGAWMCDLAKTYPHAFAGRAYWSISPPLKPGGKSPGGIPIGSGSDLAFFSEESASLLASLMAVPPNIGQLRDPDTFWKATTDALLSAKDLALVSVWSPNFFLTLDNRLRNDTGQSDFTWSDLWPNLAVLSCWIDAQSALWMPAVRERLGDVPIQGKGLLSTEGVVTIPFSQASPDPAIALTSHFFEFQERESKKIRLAHELEKNRHYEVILTTGGGLYRYATGDVVRSTGNLSLRFLGRARRSCDLVGEKLDEAQVTEALSGVAGARFLSAYQSSKGAGYRLHLTPGTESTEAASTVQSRLEQNAYYLQAIKLGQLQPLITSPLSEKTSEHLLAQLAANNKAQLGDVKIPALFRPGEWETLTTQHA